MSSSLKLTVKKIIRETSDAISIHFDPPPQAAPYLSGQFLTLISSVNGKSVRRAYSLCSSPVSDADWAVAVKRVEGGLMSNFLNEQLKEGAQIELLPPMGNFVVKTEPSKSRHFVLFGGGSGITPLYSIAKTVLKSEPGSFVSLIYGNRDSDSIIFKTGLDQLGQEYKDRFALIHVLEKPPGDWSGLTGYITVEVVKNSLRLFPQLPSTDTFYYMCGPLPMMDSVRQSLDLLGIPAAHIFRESFFSDQSKSADEKAVVVNSNKPGIQTVTILLEGKEYKVEVAPEESILQAALDDDIDMPYSCQSGLCTACRGKCLSGSVHLDEREGLSDSELKEGYVLTCVGHPITPGVIIEIG
jgi:ring-1,2-phenylacetyl-CoA epoxidase subunit PaaE